MNLNFLRKPFVILLTVPAIIALSIGLLPFLTVYLESTFATGKLSPYSLQFDGSSARTILSVVATGAMTALSLAYSLVLVVFTLAAGNIGPRLLKRFTSELANQITAGILGGTFLYATATLLFTSQNFLPKFTIAGAGLLAIISVLQLIFFVHRVSQSVSIDDEIAQINSRLLQLIDDHSKQKNFDGALNLDKFQTEILAQKSGYLGFIDETLLAQRACAAEVKCLQSVNVGEFILKDQLLLAVDGTLDEDAVNSLAECVTIEPARSDSESIGFSVNLLIEIAIRALSPGINDTFTAIAATDNLTEIIIKLDSISTERKVICDDQGEIRIITPSISPINIMDQVFFPLRQAAIGNLLMYEGISVAYARLYVSSSDALKEKIEIHVRLLLDAMDAGTYLKADLERIQSLLPKI